MPPQLSPAAAAAARLLVPLALAPLAAAQGITFQEVTANSGLDVPMMGISPGIAIGDINGDGWDDVCITGADYRKPQIFANRGAILQAGGSGPLFVEVTSLVFPAGANDSSSATFCDMDNDGDLDLVSARRFLDPLTGHGHPKHTAVEFYMNERGGREFVPLGAPESLGQSFTPFGGLTVADADLDGDLDVFYAHNGGGTGVGGPAYYLLQGPGVTFTDETANFGADLSSPTRYFSVIMADFSGDMMPDLHCAVDFFTDRHFRSSPAGVFQEVTVQAGTTNQGADMGLSLGDPDLDGDFDLYSTNINVGVFYENDGNGNFTDTAAAHGIKTFNHGLSTSVGWGTLFVDLDNDRDEDLVTVASSTAAELFENDGTGHFSKVGSGAGINLLGRSLAPIDFDNDGDVDLIVGYGDVTTTTRLYENITPSAVDRHWLVVDPVGNASNRDGIGAVIQVTTGGRTMHRVIHVGGSFKTGLPLWAHFGCGSAYVLDEVKVIWPSGAVTVKNNVLANQVLTIRE